MYCYSVPYAHLHKDPKRYQLGGWPFFTLSLLFTHLSHFRGLSLSSPGQGCSAQTALRT